MRLSAPIFAVLMLALHMVAFADDKDSISDSLAKSREAYASSLQIAHEKLIAAIDDEIRRAAASGSLELVKTIQRERTEIESDANYESKVPRLKSLISRRNAEVRSAKDKLRNSLNSAKTAYTKAMKFEEAESIDAEMKTLAVATDVARSSKTRNEPNTPKSTPDPENLADGLAVLTFSRIQGQQGNDGYVEPGKLGKPLTEPIVIKSLGKWTYDPEKNAVAFGFLKIDDPGEYHFRTYNYYDRNALFVAGRLVCPYRGSISGGSEPSGAERIILKKGFYPIVSIGYVDAKGDVDVSWKPPGKSDFSPIPDELLFHESKDGVPVAPKTR